MKLLEKVIWVENLKEFSKVFNKNSYIIAGSTFSFKSIEKNDKIRNIIVIDQLPLKYIKKTTKELIIGSICTFYDLENNKLCKELFSGFISYAASQCSSQLIRNMAGIGGNIAHANAFNIIPLIIATLDGKIKVFNGKKYSTYSIFEYYKTKPYGIITEIILPLKYSKDTFYFEKISKTSSSWESYITFSFRINIKESIIKSIRFVFGGISSIPIINKQLEDEITYRNIKEINIDDISKKYSDFIFSVNSNHKYSEYRKDVTFNTVKEFLVKFKNN